MAVDEPPATLSPTIIMSSAVSTDEPTDLGSLHHSGFEEIEPGLSVSPERFTVEDTDQIRGPSLESMESFDQIMSIGNNSESDTASDKERKARIRDTKKRFDDGKDDVGKIVNGAYSVEFMKSVVDDLVMSVAALQKSSAAKHKRAKKRLSQIEERLLATEMELQKTRARLANVEMAPLLKDQVYIDKIARRALAEKSFKSIHDSLTQLKVLQASNRSRNRQESESDQRRVLQKMKSLLHFSGEVDYKAFWAYMKVEYGNASHEYLAGRLRREIEDELERLFAKKGRIAADMDDIAKRLELKRRFNSEATAERELESILSESRILNTGSSRDAASRVARDVQISSAPDIEMHEEAQRPVQSSSRPSHSKSRPVKQELDIDEDERRLLNEKTRYEMELQALAIPIYFLKRGSMVLNTKANCVLFQSDNLLQREGNTAAHFLQDNTWLERAFASIERMKKTYGNEHPEVQAAISLVDAMSTAKPVGLEYDHFLFSDSSSGAYVTGDSQGLRSLAGQAADSSKAPHGERPSHRGSSTPSSHFRGKEYERSISEGDSRTKRKSTESSPESQKRPRH